MDQTKIRNITVIAHVDHGKTTLIDAFIKQSEEIKQNLEERNQTTVLDFNELERERGITIQAKNISIPYKGYTINVIDTPGHADFGGEVERTLKLADGCILLVDAQEGVMPQTRFVLKKALEIGLKPIVVVNKIDKKLADPQRIAGKVQDLFLSLASNVEQLEFKTFFAIGKDGKIFEVLPDVDGTDYSAIEANIEPLLEEIVNTIDYPEGDPDKPFQFQVTGIDYDTHFGSMVTGKVFNGSVSVSDSVVLVNKDIPDKKRTGKIKAINIKVGLHNESVQTASVGQIVSIVGLEDVNIGDTLCSPNHIEALDTIKVSPPSLKIKVEANTSPFLGKEGKFSSLKQLQSRLDHEDKTNVSLEFEKGSDGSYYVLGRGELHLAVFIETLRREGYEFQVRRPEVIITVVDGKKMEPVEEVYIEVPEEYYSVITQVMGSKKADLIETEKVNDQIRSQYHMLTRDLIGLKRNLLTMTKGNLVMHNQFLKLAPHNATIENYPNGRLVSSATGKALAYALNSIQERGQLIIDPNVEVYEGMIIGINKYENDISVNPTKAREKNNVRMSHAEVTMVSLDVPIQLTIEYALGFLRDDEILEVTPENLRLRKKYLNKQQEFEVERRRKKG